MPRSLPPLNSLRTFEAVARLGSFTKAARELHVTPAAVSHQVRGLESYLGVTLFRRTTRKLILTEQAYSASEHLRQAFERIGMSVDVMRSSGRSGDLSISVTPAFATRWLVSRLARFQKKHPRVNLRIAASASPADFDQDEIDVAVRIGRGVFDGAVAEKLFNEWIAPVASPSFLRQNPLRRPSDILRVPMVFDNSMRRAGRPQGWRDWFQIAGAALSEPRRAMHFDDGHLALQAAVAGGGVALGRLVYAVEDLDAKRLKIAMQPVLEMDIGYYLLIPETRSSHPAVLAFADWMKQEAEEFRNGFDKRFRRLEVRSCGGRTHAVAG